MATMLSIEMTETRFKSIELYIGNLGEDLDIGNPYSRTYQADPIRTSRVVTVQRDSDYELHSFRTSYLTSVENAF